MLHFIGLQMKKIPQNCNEKYDNLKISLIVFFLNDFEADVGINHLMVISKIVLTYLIKCI